ncbi:MAG: PD-(D/E)XK nuclease family protein, partial [Clostridia bacterium]|nr:PD-(D/E)XK nuclease family protein [Clostridia bacterium]
KGSFNTDVYSFGNYLRVKKALTNVLSKEGSAMVVKRVLEELQLNCYNLSKSSLAPSLFDLIVQLKSANVTPQLLQIASEKNTGILKDKLQDFALVFSAYEKYLQENKLEDQSSAFNYLPSILENSNEIKNADVYLIGYTGFTIAMRECVNILLKNAKSVVAILPSGNNKQAFVNESPLIIENLCKNNNIDYTKTFVNSDYNESSKRIVEGLFSAKTFKDKVSAKNVYVSSEKSINKEIEHVASIIKSSVMQKGLKYKDFTLVVSDMDTYKSAIKREFNCYDIPFFIDERKQSISHPLIELIRAYINIFKKGLNKKTFIEFAKNPLVSSEKSFSDNLVNYLYKYNIDYSRLKQSFTLPIEDESLLLKFEEKRKEIVSLITKFDVKILLEKLCVKEKIAENSATLEKLNAIDEKAINEQIYDAVVKIIDEMQNILGDKKISPLEYGRIFESGISALELSIIPQYNDAVFVGDFKEAGLNKAKNIFVVGLTSSVPKVKNDIALLSDDDIDKLSNIQLLIEPKINIVNHRVREETILGICAFSDNLYLSYPVSDYSGKKNGKSEILTYIENNFECLSFPQPEKYLTKKQGLKNFAINCGLFYDGKIKDFSEGASFYSAVEKSETKKIIEYSKRNVKTNLTCENKSLIGDVVSPTAIEDFYSCPYKFFISRVLKVCEREDGKVDPLKVGNVSHEIFKCFVPRVKEIDKNNEQNSFEKLFSDCVNNVLSRNKYVGIKSDEEATNQIGLLISECKKYCYNFYKWDCRSKFKTDSKHTELRFNNDNKDYPAIPILNGKRRIEGTIDRVDTFENYIRIIDYKTGKVKDLTKNFFSGVKIQPYLYANVFKDKMLAGAYYMPINDGFKSIDEKESSLVLGKTLDDEIALRAQDDEYDKEGGGEFIPVKVERDKKKSVCDKASMEAFKKYAISLSENCAKEMTEGVIVPSPTEDACEYCSYKALCGDKVLKRKVKTVKDQTIVDYIKEDK